MPAPNVISSGAGAFGQGAYKGNTARLADVEHEVLAVEQSAPSLVVIRSIWH